MKLLSKLISIYFSSLLIQVVSADNEEYVKYGFNNYIANTSLSGSCCRDQILGWPEGSFRFFCNILPKNPNEPFHQPKRMP